MKNRNQSKLNLGYRIKRFFKHYFGLFALALACAALMTVVLFYAFA